MSHTIRPADLADLSTIADHNIELARETTGTSLTLDVVRRGVERVFVNPQLGGYYVCKEDQHLIGQCLVLPEVSDWYNGDYWWLSSVYVVPSARRQGILAALVGLVRQQAEEARVIAIKLQVDNQNKTARRAYQELGFSPAPDQLLELRLDT